MIKRKGGIMVKEELKIVATIIDIYSDLNISFSDGTNLYISKETIIKLRKLGKINIFFKDKKHYVMDNILQLMEMV